MTPVSFAEFAEGVRKAEGRVRAGDWRGARDLYAGLLYRRVEASGVVAENELLVAERLADLAVPCGDLTQADGLYAGISEASRARREWARADLAILKRAHLALGEGRLDDAVALLRETEGRTGPLENIRFTPEGLAGWEARAAWTGADRPAVVLQFYLESGRVLAAWGQYPDAIEGFRRGLTHCANAPSGGRRADAPLRLALANALMEQGEIDEAQRELDAVGPAPDPATQPGFETARLEISARIDYLRGNFRASETALRQTLEICLKLGARAAMAQAAANLAELLLVLNRVHEAKAALDDASRFAGTLSNQALLQRIAQIGFVARCREGSPFDGEALALPVFSMQAGRPAGRDGAEPPGPLPAPDSRPAGYLSFYEERELQFLAQIHVRDLRAAAALWEWMRADFERSRSKLIRARLKVLGAVLDYETGNYGRAELMFNVASEEFRGMGLLPELYQCRRFQSLCWDKLGYPARRRAAFQEENDALLEKLAATLPPEDRDAYLLNKWRQRERLLGQEIDELARVKADAAEARGWRRIQHGWRLMRQAGVVIARIGQRPAPLWRSLLLHHPRTRTIGFLALPNSTFAYSIGWLSLRFQIGPATRVGIRGLVESYQHDMTGRDGRSQMRAARTAAALRGALGLDHLLGGIPRWVRHLTFLPDDQLYGFPMAAIPLESGDAAARYVGLRWTTSIAFPLDQPRRPARRRVQTAVVAGAALTEGYRPLPEAARQCDSLARQLMARGEDLRLLTDYRLTRDSLFDSLRNAGLFHFSGHAVLRPGDPENSGLVLPRNDAGGQVVRLLDLVSRSLESLQHVTLAACWAADGFVFPGGRVVSFTQLLAKAGVRGILAPLWEIEDRVSSEFLEVFYAQVAARSRADALRCAQRALIANGHADPYWWAGFQIYGDPGRVRI